MPDLHFATNSIAATKEIMHGGRRYLVSPVVALKAGVLNGVLVETAEFSKYAQSWAGRACPLGHPKNEGGYISANSPDVWANDVPGHFWNVEVDGDKLKGEIWIDLAKAETMGDRALSIVNRLRANQPVEVSTGYFADHDAVSGVWNGQPYLGVARNIRPDHLALLPDEVGACSWADGCGTPRVNVELAPAGADLNDQGGTSMDEPCEEERGLFEKFLKWMGQRKPDLSTNHGAIAAPVTNQEVETMSKQELIAGLTANQKCKFSKEKLETWQESDLQVLQESLGAEEQATPESGPPAEVAHSISQPETSIPPELDARFAAIENLLKGLTANSEREKAELVAAIVANAHGAWSEADLMRHDLPKLQQVYASYAPRDYSGNGGYVRANSEEEVEMLIPWPDEYKKLGV